MSKKSSSSSGPSKFSQPYIRAGANEVTSAYNENKPNVANISSNLSGGFQSLFDKFNAGNPTLDAANGYTQNVLAGNYSNPALQGMIDNTNQDVQERVQQSLGAAGRTGGDAHSAILGRELAKNETALRYGDYGADRVRQQQAASLAPSLNQAEYAGVAPLLAYGQTAAELPMSGVNSYAGDLAGLLGNYNTQTSKPSTGSAIAQGLGTAASLAGLFSDRAAKRDVDKIGEEPDGLGWYRFRYIWSDEPQIGVMADEVERLRPWALGPKVAGFATVDYSRLEAR